ncbi:MAG: hypothetical protein AB7P03_14505 [Kofleriaceae bacterium]
MTTPAPHPPQVPATSTPAVPTVPVLKDIIWERYIQALHIKRRLPVMHAFSTELDRVTRAKPFRFRNDIVWRAMLDVRDKLVIDLYSLTVEMRHGIRARYPNARVSKTKRGLFIEIRDHHLARLTRTYVPHPDDDEFEIEMHTEGKAKIFARLFPKCTTESPSAADIEDLCEEFRLKMVPLGDDRNKNRAHPLEGDAGTAKMLWVPEFEDCFDYVERLLEDLSLLSAGGSFGRTNMNHADCQETSADMVDLIVFGNISDVRRLTATRTRNELYARLHEIDDAVQADETDQHDKHYFNDRQFGPPFEDWVVVLADLRDSNQHK